MLKLKFDSKQEYQKKQLILLLMYLNDKHIKTLNLQLLEHQELCK